MAPPSEQQGIQVTAFGAVEELGQNMKLVTLPTPQPESGEVLVRMLLRPVNPADWLSVMGWYPGFVGADGLPAVPGIEGVGVVEALGEGTSGRLSVGQRVVASLWGLKQGNGTWQQYLTINEDYLVVVPDDVSDEAAACAMVNPLCVLGLVETAQASQGDWLLVNAIGSALGLMTIKYAHSLGLKVIGTVRRPEAVDDALKSGADAVICTSNEKLLERVKEITGGKGVRATFDAIGGDFVAQAADACSPGGKVIIYGFLSGSGEFKASVAPLFGNVSITGFWIKTYVESMGLQRSRETVEKCLSLIQQGIFPVVPGEKLPLGEAVKGITLCNTPGRQGKVFLH